MESHHPINWKEFLPDLGKFGRKMWRYCWQTFNLWSVNIFVKSQIGAGYIRRSVVIYFQVG